MADPVDAPVHTDDPHAPGPDVQAQIDDLRVALQDWRRTREYSQPTEERLAQITLQCARMVESLEQMEQRRDPVMPGLEERGGDSGAIAGHIEQDSGDRIRAIERSIEHEWEALREGHKEPDRELREQAVSLAESCVAAANLTVRGFARTESRLAALEHDLQDRMAQLSSDLQAVVSELRSARPQPSPGATPAFPLEGVMRIHEEMRESDAGAVSGPEAAKAGPTRGLPQSTESPTALTARVESLERVVGDAAAGLAQPIGAWRPRYAIIGLLAALAGMALFSLWIQRRVDARLSDAAARVSTAERQRDATTEETNARLVATREEAAREVAAARQSAAQAQIVGNVIAAPDLLRYRLTGVGANSRASAQVLFSRSRGMVFSASRLDSAGAGKTYQLWLLTGSGPVSAGLITPDTAGRVTLSTDAPLSVGRRVVGALVTLEPAGGGSQPSADSALIRVETPQ